MVVLGSGESIPFDSLRPLVSRCTMTCDACREVIERPVQMAHGVFNERRLKSLREQYKRPDYRKAFDLAVQRAADGVFKMYGCAEGQYCYEDADNGGYFTSGLIDTAAEWVDRATVRGYLPASLSLQITAAAVGTMTAYRKPPQNPRGGPENRTHGNEFPIAIALI